MARGTLYGLDQWIRAAAIIKKYYLAHAYCMH